MLLGRVSSADFEARVQDHWRAARFRCRAPRAVKRMVELALERTRVDGQYGIDLPHLKFTSYWLAGEHGKPGAIWINAPPEVAPAPRNISALNRPVHEHDSGRMALITRGRALFHVVVELPSGEMAMVDCPVEAGDLLLWPAWTPHTFDACAGFSLVSAMAEYVSPADDGFSFESKVTGAGDFRRIEERQLTRLRDGA